jgi:hypothetical protein
MAETKKEFIDEALKDYKEINGFLKDNAKGILHALAKEEIEEMVKESILNEDENEYEEEEIETEIDVESDEDETESDVDLSDLEDVVGVDSEIEGADVDTMDVDLSAELGMEDEITSDETELEMTQASDEDILSVFKKLTDNDEIEIVDDEVHLNVTKPGEYMIRKNGVESPNVEEANITDEEEIVYEIELDESEDVEIELSDDETIEEQIPVGVAQAHRMPAKADIGQPVGAGAKNVPGVKGESIEKTEVVNEEATDEEKTKLMEEVENLRKENADFKTLLSKFRTKLAEAVIFNYNLGHVTRLFTEHATTKDEKKEIIKRFDDNAKTIKESKRLYKSILGELSNRSVNSNIIENKINESISTSGSKVLKESTTYVDKNMERVKELMNKMK